MPTWNHADFCRARRDGTVAAAVAAPEALRLVDRLPERYQVAHHFWSWAWILSIPLLLAAGRQIPLWASLGCFALSTCAAAWALRRTAAQLVLQHATEDRAFFDYLVEHDLLVLFASPEPRKLPSEHPSS